MVEQINRLFKDYIEQLDHYDDDWEYVVLIMTDKDFNVAMTCEFHSKEQKVWSFPNIRVEDVTYQQSVKKCLNRYRIKGCRPINTAIQNVFQIHNVLYVTMYIDAFTSPIVYWVSFTDFGKLLLGESVHNNYARSAITKHLGANLWKYLSSYSVPK